MDTLGLLALSMLIKTLLVFILILLSVSGYYMVVNTKMFPRLTMLYEEILEGNMAAAIYIGLILAAFIIGASIVIS